MKLRYILSLLMLLTCYPAMGANIAVDSILDGELDELSGNGTCDLREAIQASQSNAVVDACVAGGLDDLIQLSGLSGTLSLTNIMSMANSLGSIEIVGPGPSQLVIDLNHHHFYFGQTNLSISDVTFSNGQATNGAAIEFRLTDVEIENVRVVNGIANRGGGLYLWHGTLELKNSEISGNEAAYGGGIYAVISTIVIANSTIGGNLARLNGGAIEMTEGALSLLNTTISNNRKDSSNSGGAGVYIDPLNSDFQLQIRNSIVADNYHDDGSGQITGREDIDAYPLGPPNHTIVGAIDHSIIDVSMLPALPTLAITNSLTNSQVDLTEIALGKLGFNGGSTQTFSLGSGSVALDFGDPAFSGLDCDQRGMGFPRIIGKSVDAGSFESRQDIIAHDGFEIDGIGIVCSN